MMSIYLSNTAILNIHGVDYFCIINGISKSESTSLLNNVKSEKSGTL